MVKVLPPHQLFPLDEINTKIDSIIPFVYLECDKIYISQYPKREFHHLILHPIFFLPYPHFMNICGKPKDEELKTHTLNNPQVLLGKKLYRLAAMGNLSERIIMWPRIIFSLSHRPSSFFHSDRHTKQIIKIQYSVDFFQ